jgi:hypothetical protein
MDIDLKFNNKLYFDYLDILLKKIQDDTFIIKNILNNFNSYFIPDKVYFDTFLLHVKNNSDKWNMFFSEYIDKKDFTNTLLTNAKVSDLYITKDIILYHNTHTIFEYHNHYC